MGGGPAGVMLAFLLARSGVPVTILEKHEDFFRDFRGDTIHPSTLQLMHELGLLDEFLKVPHDELTQVSLSLDGHLSPIADFTSLPTVCKMIVFMPQWDFLDFLADHGRRYPTFDLRMGIEVTDLIEEDGRVVGVKAGEEEFRAHLVIGADGRHSIVRDKAGFEVEEFGVPIDVLWTKIPKAKEMTEQALGYFGGGNFLVLINRGDYYQTGVLIRKGDFDGIQKAGLPAFRQRILSTAPFLSGYVDAVDDWSKVRLLTVQIDRLKKWHRPGLLCIGDSAHAMSPAGGVGVNLAIQDAVATANMLTAGLLSGKIDGSDLQRVQDRRLRPTKQIQGFQVFFHKRIANASATGQTNLRLPLWFARHFQFIRRFVARMTGIGPLPEHIETKPG